MFCIITNVFFIFFTEASPRGKRKLEFIDKKKARTPLSGKLIFLDVKVLKAKKRLEDDIKRLGAVSPCLL